MQRFLLIASITCYRAWRNLARNYGLEMAGYLTFLALLSIFPYVVLMASVASFVGQGETGRHLITYGLEYLPGDMVATLRPRIEEIISGPPTNILTFSILGAIWTSSSAVEAVRGMLNRAYQVRKPPAYLKRRLTSIGQVLLLTLLILSLIFIFVLVPILLKTFTYYTGVQISEGVADFFAFFYKPLAAVALFGMVTSFYRLLPNIKQRWSEVAPGALLVMVLWMAGAWGVGFYISHLSNMTLIYGSLSGYIATLLFFYMLNLIFIYGAEFNHALMVTLGHRIIEREPSEL